MLRGREFNSQTPDGSTRCLFLWSIGRQSLHPGLRRPICAIQKSSQLLVVGKRFVAFDDVFA